MDFARGIAVAIKRRLPPFIRLDDLTQEAFVGLVKAAHKFNFQSKTPFKAFAFHKVRGAVFDSVRRRNFQHTSCFQLTEHPDSLKVCQVDMMTAIEAGLDYETLVRELNRAVETLQPEDRKIVELRYGQGLNGKQAGEAMGISKGHSSHKHQTMLGNLRRRVQGSPYFEELRKAA